MYLRATARGFLSSLGGGGGRIIGLDHTILGERSSAGGLGVDVFLAGAVDSDLDSNLAAFDHLAVHLTDSLLLQLLRSERDKSEATTFASLTPGKELLDHVAGDRTESDLGGGRIVCGEQFLKLKKTINDDHETDRTRTLTFSSLRSYGRLATMTLFLDGIPSSGGPR